jgi:hypothetical protein
VASWRVLAGEAPHALKATITVPDNGFESSAILPQKHSYVAVQALGGSGEVLRASSPSKVVSYASSLP